jgi:hypothetical protein
MKKIIFLIPFVFTILVSFAQNGTIKQYNDNIQVSDNGVVLNKVYHVGDSAWTDLRAPATTVRQGATAKPDFNSDSLTLDFPQDNEAEIAYVVMQMGHDYLTGSNVNPHLHILRHEASVPVFIIRYRVLQNGVATHSFVTDTTIGYVFSYTSGSQLDILKFPEIDMSAVTGVSSILDIQLYRKTGDGVSGDIQVKEFDIHYQSDTKGSDSQFNKSWE